MSVVTDLLLGVLLMGQQIAGAPADEQQSASSRAVAEFTADAKDYVMRLDARPSQPLKLREEPLFHWGNPARTGEDGALFVWMLNGRPQVIGSVFTYRLSDVIRRKHEYHSLADGPLTATYLGRRVWAPRQAGVHFEPLPGSPPVRETTRARLSQMKTIARDFSARLQEYNGDKSELRLLPRPLLNYQSTDQRIEGAIFSFSLATDPEVILILEARLGSGSPSWQYALARFHFVDLRASYRDQEVWHAEAMPTDITTLDIGTTKYQDSVYATYHTKATPITEP